MIRNIIFDWSGTLVDDLPAVLIASNAVFRQAGVPEMSLDEFRREFCLPFKRFYDRYVPHVPLERLEDWFHAAFREAQDQVAPLPHAEEFLGFCRAEGMRTFLLSSVHPRHYEAQAAATGFGEFIDTPYVAVWDKRERIGSLLKEHGLDPSETLFIGDMEHDIETARHGGVRSCAVLTGYNDLDQLRAAGPDLIVEHLGELQRLLENDGLPLEEQAGGTAHQVPEILDGADCGMPVATVGGLIFNERNEVLMVRTRKWSSLWGIPGGKIKGGERSEDALRRELEEETGLRVKDIRLVLAQDCISSTEFYRDAHFLLLNFTCRCVSRTGVPSAPSDAVESGACGMEEAPTNANGDRRDAYPTVRLNDEAQAYRWVTLEEALGMALNTPTRILIEAVLNGDGGPFAAGMVTA